MIFIRSALFNLCFFVWTVCCLVFLLWVLVLPRKIAIIAPMIWQSGLAFLLRHLANITHHFEGTENLPPRPFILAAKHQSAWETLTLHLIIKDPVIIYKRELGWIPLLGWYLVKCGMISVDRSKGSKAMKRIIEHSAKPLAEGRPIVIFPQGTRVPVGEKRPYKQGVGTLYEKLNLPIVPAALDSGVYWPKRSFIKRPGTITVRFLKPIMPGKTKAEAMKQLEETIETETDKLIESKK